MEKTKTVPWAFFWRRIHSLSGLWISLFLIEHLLVNSQAALYIGDDGAGFIRAVNSIKNLSYLPVLEIFLLGMPILTHMIFGIEYLRTGKLNSFPTDGTKPSLTKYSRNHAYSWQRITSWVLVFLLVGHILHMRFFEYPSYVTDNGKTTYVVRLDYDEGLSTLAPRLKVELYDQKEIETSNKSKSLVEAFQKRPLGDGQVVAAAPDFGTAELLMVRETFKWPVMIALYTLFVLAAVFHGFNGLWTFLITWGIALTERSQRIMRHISTGVMIVVAFWGLAAIWGTTFINLSK